MNAKQLNDLELRNKKRRWNLDKEELTPEMYVAVLDDVDALIADVRMIRDHDLTARKQVVELQETQYETRYNLALEKKLKGDSQQELKELKRKLQKARAFLKGWDFGKMSAKDKATLQEINSDD